jgi:hypothetical protein
MGFFHVRLIDVQTALRSLLPPDAILVGQSLNSDLDALKLMHPYIIGEMVLYRYESPNLTSEICKVWFGIIPYPHGITGI